MNKKQKVDALITANVGWTEEDREWLLAQDESRLDRMLPVKNKSNLTEGSGKAPGAGATDEEEESGECAGGQTKKTLGKGKKLAKNQEEDEDEDTVENEEGDDEDEELTDNEEVTVEEFIGMAPPEIREVLNAGMASAKKEKSKLIATITGNRRCKFSKESLEQKDLSELRLLASLASNEEPDYSGSQGEAPVGNTKREGLALPTLNFTKKESR